MFISPEMKSNLLLVGFGESHVAVLCDWYQDSLDAYSAAGESGNRELALWSVLEDIRDDQEALSIFIVENMVAPGAQAKILAWAFRGILPTLSTSKSDSELIAQTQAFLPAPALSECFCDDDLYCPRHAPWKDLNRCFYGCVSTSINPE